MKCTRVPVPRAKPGGPTYKGTSTWSWRLQTWSLIFVCVVVSGPAVEGAGIEPLWSLDLKMGGVVGELTPLAIADDGGGLTVAASGVIGTSEGEKRHPTTIWRIGANGQLAGSFDIGSTLKLLPGGGTLLLALPRSDGGLALLIESNSRTLLLAMLNEKGELTATKSTTIPAGGVTFASVWVASGGGYLALGQRGMKPLILRVSEDGTEQWWREVDEASAGRGCGSAMTEDGGSVVALALSDGVLPSTGKQSVLIQRLSASGEVIQERRFDDAECGGFGPGRDYWILVRDRSAGWQILVLDEQLAKKHEVKVAQLLQPVFYLKSVGVGADSIVALDLQDLAARISWIDMEGPLRKELILADTLGPMGGELFAQDASTVYVLVRSVPTTTPSGTIDAGLRLIRLQLTR